MSALGAIETQVPSARQVPGAGTIAGEPGARPLRAVDPARPVAAPAGPEGAANREPRSSSIPRVRFQRPGGPQPGARVIRAVPINGEWASSSPHQAASAPPAAVRTRTGTSAAGAAALPPRAERNGAASTATRTARNGAASTATRAERNGAANARLRLTRRGRVVVAILIVSSLTAALLVITMLASGGAQATNHGAARAGYQGMHQVVVQPGQTLWSIATAAEPTADPRIVIGEIMSANALQGSGITAGQLLWVP